MVSLKKVQEQKMEIEPLRVEIYSDITEEGIWSNVYFGESDSPSAEHTLNWDDWVEQQLEFYTVPSKQYIPYEEVEQLKDVFTTVKALRYAADVLEERLMALDGFDRKAWVAAGGVNVYHQPIEPFLKPMSELVK
jgi:hypothetical protein